MMEEKVSYYSRYRQAAARFLLIGGVCAAVGALLMAGLPVSLPLPGALLLFVGVLLAALGGSSLQSHNTVKAFARQCITDPDEGTARGLLQALQAHRKLALVQGSLQLVENAIIAYERSPGADPQLAEQLRATAEKNLVRKRF